MFNIIKESRTILQSTPRRWANLTQALSSDLLNLEPAPGEWSALDCLQHLVDTERWVFPIRVKSFLAGQDFPAFDPDSQGDISQRTLSAMALSSEFKNLRDESLTLLDSLTTTDLSRQARHADLGQVTLSEMLYEWAGHDLMHTVQAERALLQPFIKGSGPWQPYFKDHLVER